MQTYEIIVSGRAVHANSADTTLVRTSIGIDKIHVLFDNEEWTSFPVRVTFANGDTIISTSLTLAEIDAPEWAAEAECAIPWEVIQDLGGIRITFQGTDASGNHIITEASGEPLSVVEAGDVGSGTVPSPAPSVDEWNQAYANAMAAASDAASAAEQISEILHSTDAQTLEELIAALGSALRYKGSVSTYADLPEDAEQGDTYNVATAYGDYPAETNWAWTGEAWDALGGEIDLSQFATKDVATQSADGLMSSTDKTKLDGIEANANAYSLPTMSPTIKGGATLGSGLTVDDGALSLGDLVQSSSGAEVATDGCAIFSVEGEGWATQDGTPTPDNPVEIEVARGRNLFNPNAATTANSYATYSVDQDGTIHASASSAYAYAIYEIDTSSYDALTLSLGASSTNNVRLETNRYINGGWEATQVTNPGNSRTIDVSTVSKIKVTVSNGTVTGNLVFAGIQLELGTTPTPYVPYGHVGLEVQGKNLLPQDSESAYSTAGWTIGGSSTGVRGDFESGQYTISAECVTAASGKKLEFGFFDADGTNVGGAIVSMSEVGRRYATVTLTGDAVRVRAYLDGGACKNIQIEAGSTAHAYEPYHHTTTPIPLPAKGFVASLPDGTADALTVDSAGRWEWVNEIARIASYNGESVGSVYMSTTGQLTTGAEVYYKSAQASEHGYIDVPAIPDGSTVSIPELLEIGVAWFVHGAKELVEHATNERKRVEDALSDVYEAIADL